MSGTLCSIIIPAYNHGKYIERSVQSALDQTYKNVEIIVADDGSTDDTFERVAQFGDRINYIRKENTGRGDNRNRALIESSGTYIQFLDADDYIDPTKLEKQVPIIDNDDEIAVVYSDCSCNDPSGEEIGNASYPLRDDEDPLPLLLGRTLFGIHAAITRRDAIMAVGMFDPHPLAQEDWDLWLKLALAGYKYKYVPGDLARYDQAGSGTVVNARLMYRRMKHMLDKYLTDDAFQRLDKTLVNRFIAQQNLQLGSRAYNNRWWSAAREHFLTAAKAEPSLMTTSYLSCIPKSYFREFADRVKGETVIPPNSYE